MGGDGGDPLLDRVSQVMVVCDDRIVFRAGRVFSPDVGLDGPGSVVVTGARITVSGSDIGGVPTIDLPDGILLPGLIDCHAHPANWGSRFGVDPDVNLLPRGTTTVLSQGDAGATTLRRFLETTVRVSRTRVVLALNLSSMRRH